MASKKGGCKPLLLFGQEAEQLVSNCNDVPFDLSTLFSSDVVEFIELIGKQRSFHPMFMANTLMPIVAHLLSDSKVVVSPTRSEPLLVWSVSIGMKSSGKSPFYQFCKKLQASNIIPGLCLETRKKYTKEQQCKYFLKVTSWYSLFIDVVRFSVWLPMTFSSCQMMSPL